MNAKTTCDGESTLLRALLKSRHWQKHSTFTREWDKAARSIDPKLVGAWPRHAQFYRWLRGEIRELPYPDACRVLEVMFPEHDVKELFRPVLAQVEQQESGRVSARSAPTVSTRELTGRTSPDIGLSNAWPQTNSDVLDDLIARVEAASEEVTVFGLTRNFYAKDEMLPIFESKAIEVPVTFYVMEPNCESRRDRYRLEPAEAAMEDPARYTREILRPLFLASQRVSLISSPVAGMRIFTYNFPCSFAIEKIDDSCRVMLYGHGKRGTESPLFVFDKGTSYWDYFNGQISWLERLATDPWEPWTSKGLVVHPLREDDLASR